MARLFGKREPTPEDYEQPRGRPPKELPPLPSRDSEDKPNFVWSDLRDETQLGLIFMKLEKIEKMLEEAMK